MSLPEKGINISIEVETLFGNHHPSHAMETGKHAINLNRFGPDTLSATDVTRDFVTWLESYLAEKRGL